MSFLIDDLRELHDETYNFLATVRTFIYTFDEHSPKKSHNISDAEFVKEVTLVRHAMEGLEDALRKHL